MKYEMWEDSGAAERFDATDDAAAIAHAMEWVSEGEYESRCLVEGGVRRLDIDDDGEEDWIDVDMFSVEAGPEPDPGECEGSCDGEHEWSRPHHIVGGCRENPGVWGAGGNDLRLLHVCCFCGKYRHTFGRGTPNPGELDEEITFEDADEASIEWRTPEEGSSLWEDPDDDDDE